MENSDAAAYTQHYANNSFFAEMFEKFLKQDHGRMKIIDVVKFNDSIKFDIVLKKYKNHNNSNKNNNSKNNNNSSSSSSSSSPFNIKYIGSGSYADVFRLNGLILKLIRLLPEELIQRIQSSTITRSTRYIDAFNEYQISYALYKLQQQQQTAQNHHHNPKHLQFQQKNSFNLLYYYSKIFPQIYCAYLTYDNISYYLNKIKHQQQQQQHQQQQNQKRINSRRTTGTSTLTSTSSYEDNKTADNIIDGAAGDNDDADGLGENLDRYLDLFEDYNFTIPKENLIILMEDCGELMADLMDNLSPLVLLSILKQIIVGLMIAELALEFEHRDLHSGNILLQKCQQTFIRFKCENRSISIPSYGYRVKIIDTTFSRLKYKNVVYFKDMTSLFENFEEKKVVVAQGQQQQPQQVPGTNGEKQQQEANGIAADANNNNDKNNDKNNENKKMKMQDVIYEQMAQIINNNWHKFFPKTNILWIKYVIYKLMKSLASRKQQQEKEKQQQKRRKQQQAAAAATEMKLKNSDDLPPPTLASSSSPLSSKSSAKATAARAAARSSSTTSTSASTTFQVSQIMERYNRLLDKCSSLKEFFPFITTGLSGLNDIVPIIVSTSNSSNSSRTTAATTGGGVSLGDGSAARIRN